MDRKQFFDQLAPEWEKSAPADLSQRLERVVSMSRISPGCRILDVGTGTGGLIRFILKAIGKEGYVLAIDISPDMIAVAKSKGFPANVELQVMDAHNLNVPDNSFDTVMCNAVFPHFEDKESALRELQRVLRPGGTLVISHPIGREAVNKLHSETGSIVAEDRVPTPEQMRDLLERMGFVNIEILDEPEFYIAISRKPAS